MRAAQSRVVVAREVYGTHMSESVAQIIGCLGGTWVSRCVTKRWSHSGVLMSCFVFMQQLSEVSSHSL